MVPSLPIIVNSQFIMDANDNNKTYYDSEDYSYANDDDDDDESLYDSEDYEDFNGRFEIVPNIPSVRELERFEPYIFYKGVGFVEYWEQAGEEIGRHDYLETLTFDDIEGIADGRWDAFMRGMANNRSIKKLRFDWVNWVWGRTFQILAPFIEHNSNLTTLEVVMSESLVPRQELSSLSSIFRQCGTSSSLTKLDFICTHMGDEAAADLISSLNNLPHLQELNLNNNAVGMRGCQSLAVLLRNSESKLKSLNLTSNNIGDAEVAVLASALYGNNALTTLVLTNTHRLADTISQNSITEIGWGAISKVLRDSNHALKEVINPRYPEVEMSHPKRQDWQHPDLQAVTTNELRHLLKMNTAEDKAILAQQKAILFRFTIDTQFTSPLTEQKMLPAIIAWIDRQSVEYMFSSLFELIRATPDLWNT